MRKMVLRVSAALAVLCLAVTLNVYAEGGNKNHQIVVLDPTKPAPPADDENGGGSGGGDNVPCPNGGYWATGNRTESIITHGDKMTVAYMCDQHPSGPPCLTCNRYSI